MKRISQYKKLFGIEKEIDLKILKKRYRNLAKEWHPTKNKKTANEIRAGSPSKAWWICKQGHVWSASIASRNSGNGCPYCSNRFVGR